jgi:hypothetical protein
MLVAGWGFVKKIPIRERLLAPAVTCKAFVYSALKEKRQTERVATT